MSWGFLAHGDLCTIAFPLLFAHTVKFHNLPSFLWLSGVGGTNIPMAPQTSVHLSITSVSSKFLQPRDKTQSLPQSLHNIPTTLTKHFGREECHVQCSKCRNPYQPFLLYKAFPMIPSPQSLLPGLSLSPSTRGLALLLTLPLLSCLLLVFWRAITPPILSQRAF